MVSALPAALSHLWVPGLARASWCLNPCAVLGLSTGLCVVLFLPFHVGSHLCSLWKPHWGSKKWAAQAPPLPHPQLFILPASGEEASGSENPSATSHQESLVLRASCPGLACWDAEKPPFLVGDTALMLSFCFSPDIMKSKSNPDFLKKDRSSVSRQLRNIRSKVSSQLFPCNAGGQRHSPVGI